MSDYATTDRVDYLQRCGPPPAWTWAHQTAGAPASRRLAWVKGVGRPEKERPAQTTGFKPDRWRPPTTELITGLYGYRIPLAFYIVGSSAGVQVHLGTWSAKAPRADVQERRLDVIESVLRGLYSTVGAVTIE